MQKRGQGVTTIGWVLIELVLLAFLFVALFNYVGDVQDYEFFEKSYITKDLALLANTIQSIPGDVTFYYQQDKFPLWEYDFSFDNNEMAISEPGDLLYRVSYPYYLSTAYHTTLTPLLTPLQFVFVKEDSWFEVREHADISFFEKLECGDDVSTILDKDTIVIDSSMNEFSMTVENYLLGKVNYVKESSTNQGEDLSVIDEDTNLVISIKQNSEITEKMEVEAFIPGLDETKDQNAKLACLVLNQLLEYFPDIQINVPAYSNEDVLYGNPEGLALQLVFTNPKENAIDVASVINQGLDNYYQDVE